MKNGVILNNIGSPKGPDVRSVRVYLREFLMDPGVISLPFLLRFILVYLIITPFRAAQSAKKYQKIWTKEGSPLVVITQSIAKKLKEIGNNIDVETGMQFQSPSIRDALTKLSANNSDLERIYFIPMFPQYSFATTAASIKKLNVEFDRLKGTLEKEKKKIPDVFIMKPFYNNDFFIDCVVNKIKFFNLENYDLILFSYHGLPKSAILKTPGCQLSDQCCEVGMKKNCYRSQCFATTKAVMGKLNTGLKSLSTFQSRLGRSEWIQPYTDQTLIKLAQNNVKKILIVCPSFTVDCLETLEEIQIENKNLFLKAGGEIFDYVFCLNDDDTWTRNLSSSIQIPDHFDRL